MGCTSIKHYAGFETLWVKGLWLPWFESKHGDSLILGRLSPFGELDRS